LPSLLIQHAPLIVILALQILSLPGLLSSQTILLCAAGLILLILPLPVLITLICLPPLLIKHPLLFLSRLILLTL
jgi:hypothetical protein